MTFEEYQRLSRKTAGYPKIGENFVYPALGLCGESGEVVEKIKKIFRDDKGKITAAKKTEIEKELGDVLWYLSQIATEFKISLDDIAGNNVKKLYSRLKREKIHGSGDDR